MDHTISSVNPKKSATHFPAYENVSATKMSSFDLLDLVNAARNLFNIHLF